MWLRIWTRIREAYDWAERVHFWPLVWKVIKEFFGWITGGGLLMTIAALIADWGAFGVFCAALLGVAVVGIIAIVWRVLHLSRPIEPPVSGPQDEFSERYPNLRVADHQAVLSLFEGDERDKLFPLLEVGKLTAWARPMYSGLPPGSGNAPLTKLPGETWASHIFFHIPSSGPGTINQTFIKTKGAVGIEMVRLTFEPRPN
jgi:hypothetical protein